MKHSLWFLILTTIFVAAFFALPTQAALPSPVAHWSFDDGTEQDVSGNFDGDGTTTATPKNPSDCVVGKCFEFDEDEDERIVIPAPPGSALDTGSEVSVSAWFIQQIP